MARKQDRACPRPASSVEDSPKKMLLLVANHQTNQTPSIFAQISQQLLRRHAVNYSSGVVTLSEPNLGSLDAESEVKAYPVCFNKSGCLLTGYTRWWKRWNQVEPTGNRPLAQKHQGSCGRATWRIPKMLPDVKNHSFNMLWPSFTRNSSQWQLVLSVVFSLSAKMPRQRRESQSNCCSLAVPGAQRVWWQVAHQCD